MFNSILAGIETTLGATGMVFHRLGDDEIFQLARQSLNPRVVDARRLRPARIPGRHESVRARISNVSIEGESDEYLKVGGLLWSFITVKDPPDATYPGILRELLAGLPDTVLGDAISRV